MPTITTKQRQILVGGTAVAFAFVLGVSIDGDDPQTREAKLESVGSAIEAGSAVSRPNEVNKVDTATLHATLRGHRNADPDVIDVGGDLVQPDAVTTAGVMLALGARPAGVGVSSASVIGVDASSFTIEAVTYEDKPPHGTWIVVTARNNSESAARFLALVELMR